MPNPKEVLEKTETIKTDKSKPSTLEECRAAQLDAIIEQFNTVLYSTVTKCIKKFR